MFRGRFRSSKAQTGRCCTLDPNYEEGKMLGNRRTLFKLLGVLSAVVLSAWILTAGALATVLASMPPGLPLPGHVDTRLPGSGTVAGQPPPVADGLDKLPVGQQGLSYSTLVHMGRAHPPASNANQHSDSSWHNPFSPLLNISWGP